MVDAFPKWLVQPQVMWRAVVLVALERFQAYYTFHFHFKLSNNEAEYEALLSNL